MKVRCACEGKDPDKFCRKCYDAKRFQDNKIVKLSQGKAWRKQNPDKVTANERSSRQKHLDLAKQGIGTGTNLRTRYMDLKRAAKRRNKEFMLTLDEYKEIVKDQKCSYCNDHLPSSAGGLDRIDNSKGYAKDNVVPACERCNKVRNTYFTIEQMKILGPMCREFAEENNKGS